MENLNVVLRSKVVEPRKRLKGNLTPDWIIHRFPIKGGISLRDAWLIDMSRPNPLLKLLLERNNNGIITKSE
jgi:hypothetical protein